NIDDINYIKDIEWFYLKIKGKGIMLSSKDYNLIEKWYKRSIPKQVIFEAIQSSFNIVNSEKINCLMDIEENINDYIKDNYLNLKDFDYHVEESREKLKTIIKRLKNIKSSNENEILKKSISNLENNLLNLFKSQKKNIFEELKIIEDDFFVNLFSYLPGETKIDISKKAEALMPKESRFYDKVTKEITLKSFKKDILLKTLGIINIFDLKNEKVQ
nr:hypothetical protein [Candidatus Dadabacteria bacterium]NIQ14327.1 hypothetical protein [Candidatus Dadabacteria bacterium]